MRLKVFCCKVQLDVLYLQLKVVVNGKIEQLRIMVDAKLLVKADFWMCDLLKTVDW